MIQGAIYLPIYPGKFSSMKDMFAKLSVSLKILRILYLQVLNLQVQNFQKVDILEYNRDFFIFTLQNKKKKTKNHATKTYQA